MRSLPKPTTRWTIPGSIAALSIAGGALGVVAVGPLVRSYLYPLGFPDFWPPEVSEQIDLEILTMQSAIGLSTSCLLGLALALSLRSEGWLTLKTVGWCVLAAWLNVAAALCLGHLLLGDPIKAFEALGFGLLTGWLFGVPLGLLYGAFAAMAIRRLRTLTDRPSLTVRVDAQLVVGATILGAGLFGVALHYEVFHGKVPIELPIAVTASGGVGLIQALVRRHLLRRIASAPDRHGYERVPLAELGVDRDQLWPLHPGVPLDASHALVRRTEETGDGAYRRSTARVPLALVA